MLGHLCLGVEFNEHGEVCNKLKRRMCCVGSFKVVTCSYAKNQLLKGNLPFRVSKSVCLQKCQIYRHMHTTICFDVSFVPDEAT